MMTRQYLRILSSTTLILSLAIGFFSTSAGIPCSLSCAIGLSLSILFPRLSRAERSRRTRTLAYVHAALAAGTMTLSFLPGVNVASLAFITAMAVVLPVSYRFVAAGLDAASDLEYINIEMQGWEISIYYGNVMHVSLSVSVFLVCLIAVVMAGGSVFAYVPVAVMALLYVYMFMRNVAGDDNILAKQLKSKMKKRVINLLLPDRGREISVNYRMMFNRIKEYMEQKRPYLNPEFGLEDMAKAMYTNSGYISRLINTCTGGNFSQFVNSYRVRYAMELYRRDMSLKVLELTQLSGFNTKVTFNMAFKLVNGETPGEWCRRYQANMLKTEDPSSQKAHRK